MSSNIAKIIYSFRTTPIITQSIRIQPSAALEALEVSHHRY
jgi:hypothetical protein